MRPTRNLHSTNFINRISGTLNAYNTTNGEIAFNSSLDNYQSFLSQKDNLQLYNHDYFIQHNFYDEEQLNKSYGNSPKELRKQQQIYLASKKKKEHRSKAELKLSAKIVTLILAIRTTAVSTTHYIQYHGTSEQNQFVASQQNQQSQFVQVMGDTNALAYNFKDEMLNQSSLFYGSEDASSQGQAERPLLFTLAVKVLVALVGE
ncbi:uncharacterized protein LOC142344816 isoform X2 [Convolutriloba macropyga]|uniref:uncharacterized protein LOC142344816 isoform X2 n=1 Tax=Convolutriloba macropyga TaxID=536237 RepID=UPI003F524730